MAMENVENIYKLSPIQSGMLFHVINEPDSDVYFGQYSCTLTSVLNIEVFQQAWQHIIKRHTVLRTIFLWENVQEPLQIIRKHMDLNWQILDWQEQPPAEQQSTLQNYLDADKKQAFDLTQAPLLRFSLIKLSPEQTQFIWSTHHLILDGWSMALIINEMRLTYEHLLSNSPLLLDPPSPYSDYIAWFQQQDLNKAESYWRQTLAGFTEPTRLPIRQEISDISDYNSQYLAIEKETTTHLREAARSHRLTMSTLIQGAWSILLERYTHQQDVVFGVTLAGRPVDLVDVDKRVGLFINTLPARVKLSPKQSLQDLLSVIQRQQTELREYESTPLVNVQQWSEVPTGESLFESIVVFENYPVNTNNEYSLKIENILFTEHSHYPLSLLVFPDQHQLHFKVVYDQALFPNPSIKRLLGHLQTLLGDMVSSLDKPVEQLTILTQQEQQQLKAWNNTQLNYSDNHPIPSSANPCIHQLIEAHSQLETNALVTADNQSLSHAKLHHRANQLAHALQNWGVKSGSLVGLYINRSIEMVVGILGILKAGGAYVPLDPNYPTERLALILSDFASSQTTTETLVVTESNLSSNLTEIFKHSRDSEKKVQLICIDTDLQEYQKTTPENRSGANDTAYMIYTSGSSGKPKGVLVNHHNLVHATLAREHYYPDDLKAFLLVSSFAFDSSIAGIFWCLTQGKTLVLPKPDQEKDIEALVNLIDHYQVTHTLCIPSLYQLFLSYADVKKLGSLSHVIVAGETCSKDLLEQHDQTLPNTALYNEYGPTEATVWCSVSQLSPSHPITIGKPISNTQIHILDEQLSPVPVGVSGEVYIAGEGVTQGYFNRPEATARSFISDPFSTDPNVRCYRTGDLARYQTNGQIEFLGRVDQQVKIHGYRIELGEIEFILKQYTGVLEARVLAKDEQLMAYVTTNQALSTSNLQALLARKLPVYMQPSRIFLLDEFPLLANGKLDLHALSTMITPSLEYSEHPAEVSGFIAPRNKVEQTLADIWADILGMDSISINDHFLQIGGDSILSIQMIARARQAGLYFTPRDLFEYPEIGLLAEIVETKASSESLESQQAVEGEVALTPIQHWFFEIIKPAPQHWNQAIQLTTPATLTAKQLHQALQFICQHHDALRMCFTSSEQGWQQFNQGNNFQLPWQEVDLSGFSVEQQEEMIEEMADELQTQLDFSNSSLQTVFFQLGDKTVNRLLMISHHLVIDHISWGILLEDLEQLCQQLLNQKSLQLLKKTLSYQSWAKQLIADAQSTKSTKQRTQWLDFLPMSPASLPIDFPEERGNMTEESHQIFSDSLSKEQTQRLLQDVPDTYQTKINDVLLTALLQTLYEWTNNTSWLIDMELHGRDQGDIDLSRTIGWFTCFFPVALQWHETEIGALLKSVKEQIRQIPQKGQSYGPLRYLSANHELAELAQADILFNYLGKLPQSTTNLCRTLPDAKNGRVRSLLNKRSHLLEINIVIAKGELIANWSYSHSLYQQSTIEKLATSFMTTLQDIIKHCQLPETGGFTPSDFTDSNLDQNQLDQFIDSIIK